MFDDREHVPLATLPGMRDRTVTISSGGKTFNLTGWKIGWVCSSPALVTAVTTAKQFLTYVSGAPFQPAIAAGLDLPDEYFTDLAADLAAKRDQLCAGLDAAGFKVFRPQGTYFVTVDIRPLRPDGDGMAFCRGLPDRCGVVAVPNEVFYDDPDEGRHLVRFSFSKRHEVLATPSPGWASSAVRDAAARRRVKVAVVQHDIVWEDSRPTSPASRPRSRPRRRRGRAWWCSPRCSPPASRCASTAPRSPRTGPRRSSSPSGPPLTGCGCAARAPRWRPPASTPTTRSSWRGRTARCTATQAPPVQLRRRGPVVLGGQGAGDRRGRGRAHQPVRLLRPALRRRLLGARARHRRLRVRGQLAGARRHHWSTLLRARAIENQAYVVAADRVGQGGKLAYAGDSAIIDPLGETLVAADGAEALLVADVTAARVAEVRDHFPSSPTVTRGSPMTPDRSTSTDFDAEIVIDRSPTEALTRERRRNPGAGDVHGSGSTPAPA